MTPNLITSGDMSCVLRIASRDYRGLDPGAGVPSSRALDAAERSGAQLPSGARAPRDCRNPISAADAAAAGLRDTLENDLAVRHRAAVMACQPGRRRHAPIILRNRARRYPHSHASLGLHFFQLPEEARRPLALMSMPYFVHGMCRERCVSRENPLLPRFVRHPLATGAGSAFLAPRRGFERKPTARPLLSESPRLR
jgi:hypothetical protein